MTSRPTTTRNSWPASRATTSAATSARPATIRATADAEAGRRRADSPRLDVGPPTSVRAVTMAACPRASFTRHRRSSTGRRGAGVPPRAAATSWRANTGCMPGCGQHPLVAAARGACVLAGAHGTGPNGDLVRDTLAREGIGWSSPPLPDRDTGICFVMIEPTARRTSSRPRARSDGITREPAAERAGAGDLVCISGSRWSGAPATPCSPGSTHSRMTWSSSSTPVRRSPRSARASGAVIARVDVWTSNAAEARPHGPRRDGEAAPRSPGSCGRGVSPSSGRPQGYAVHVDGRTTVLPGHRRSRSTPMALGTRMPRACFAAPAGPPAWPEPRRHGAPTPPERSGHPTRPGNGTDGRGDRRVPGRDRRHPGGGRQRRAVGITASNLATGRTSIVIMPGAGLSGIGAACHLERERPGTTYAIIEQREAAGGTWDLFRYPGVLGLGHTPSATTSNHGAGRMRSPPDRRSSPYPRRGR